MKRFASLLLAAILGSVFTFAALQWFNTKEQGVKLEYLGAPVSKVAYTITEDGKAVPLDFTGTAEKVMPAVVYIRSVQEGNSGKQEQEVPEMFRDFFGPQFRTPQGPQQSSGSGVIINSDGYVVTNNHVVDGADMVEVLLTDNRTYKAKVIGTDPDTDIALIKIDATGLPSLPFVDSDKARVGEWVLAVGNPYNLTSTVTAGIISAKGRSINILSRNNYDESQGGSTAIESFIQTDAAINPGNSGGALVDLSGGLLGINTAIASPTGSYSGYGFAVPANIVSKVVEDLIKYGVVQRGWLGVTIQSVNNQLVNEKGLTVREGAYITHLAENSGARDAGLKEGDVVVAIDGNAIRSNTELTETIGRHRPGDKVDITVNRDGKEITKAVTLKTRDGRIGTVKREDLTGLASLGLELEEVPATDLKKLDIAGGVRVKDLGNGKLARYTDIREGFVITRVNDKGVNNVKEFTAMLKSIRTGEVVTLSGIYENSPREYLYSFRM